ncbi:RNA polymerase sigma-70 factor [Flavobacteriaceae bacterium F08102]|nr:RNA polymerase sigma-70 factor [Flavobacteriaceae bacterium F08102]
MDDLSLIKAIVKGDESAFKTLFNRHYDKLVGYITTFTNDFHVAEDIAQQTFVVIWTKKHKFKTLKSPKSYFYSIAYNLYIDHHRKRKAQSVFFDELREQALRNTIIEDEELSQKRINKLKSIIDSFPPRCKKIFELNKFSGLKYKEIAAQLNISERTVETQMRIAFRKIHKGFEKFENKNLILFLRFFKFSNANSRSF